MSTTDTGSPDEPDEAGSRRSAENERAGSTPQTADTTELEDDDDDDPVREAKSRDAESPGAFIDDPNPPEPNEPG